MGNSLNFIDFFFFFIVNKISWREGQVPIFDAVKKSPTPTVMTVFSPKWGRHYCELMTLTSSINKIPFLTECQLIRLSIIDQNRYQLAHRALTYQIQITIKIDLNLFKAMG